MHREQGVPVAVKVITAKRAQRVETLEAFKNEIRAIAGLDHPGVVMVFDHGQISVAAERLSRGALTRGSPYLVMELASRGSLGRLKEPLRWKDLRLVLLSLLQALAHAHACGVIHRDLKPGNVLMAGAEDMRPGLKLTDFGIAHVIDGHTRAGSHEISMGTPLYMAPEQLRGQWRDYGPWTDFYALGCMIWKLATGEFAFRANNFAEICRLHLTVDPPPLETSHAVPAGFEGWLRCMLAKSPKERFECAADAIYALEQLDGRSGADDAEGLAGAVGGDEVRSETLSDLVSATVVLQDELAVRALLSGRKPQPDEASSVSYRSPPIPETWTRAERPPDVKLLGAGLGLYGLRTTPLVGRQRERDALWEALRCVHRDKRAQMVLLTGAAGVGKSRLIEWIGERAHELGAAQVLEARHSPIAGPSFGLPGMVVWQMRCQGLSHRDTLKRCEVLLGELGVREPYEWAALAELMVPSTEGDEPPEGAPRVHFSRASERHVLVLRHLERLAQRRPLIVWLDDVQWSVEALDFVAYALSQQDARPSPLLFVLTARDESLAERRQAWWSLRELLQQPCTSQLELGPLPPQERARLVQDLLVLQGDVAKSVEQRCAGNPQFAVQLIGDWVSRGVLEMGPQGFRLRRDEQAVLPDSLYGVWSARVHRLLEGHPPAARSALELAAALGQHLRNREWREACEAAGVSLPEGLLDRLLSARLARVSVDGWSFAHGMLRETLARGAREGGRWEGHHGACVAMLSALYADGGRGVSERRAHHLLGAGRLREAVDALLKAANECLTEQDVKHADELLERREEALTQLQVSTSNPIWGEGWLAMAKGRIYQDRFSEAQAQAEKAQRAARRHGWSLLPEALRTLGTVARRRGEFEAAADLYHQALSPFEEQNDATGLAYSLHGLAEVVQRRGDSDLAYDLTEKALKHFREVNNDVGVAMSLKMLGQISHSRGNERRCEDLFRQALRLYERLGHKFGVANAHNVLADVARHQGDFEAAERGYRQSLEHLAAVGGQGLIPRLNLGLTLVGRGELQQAKALLEEVLQSFKAQNRLGFLVFVHAALMACAPGEHDWHAWDRHHQAIRRLLSSHVQYDRDIAWCAQLAAANAADAGERARAGEAYELALDQWKGVGDDDKVNEVGVAWALLSV